MDKCPVCGSEYEVACKTCNPETQGEVAAGKSGPEESSAGEAEDGAVLLTTVSDNFEASLIETRLRQNGIPVLLKYRESGAYLSFYMGKTSFGVDIYVPGASLEDARMLVSPPQDYAAETAMDLAEDSGESATDSMDASGITGETGEVIGKSAEGTGEATEDPGKSAEYIGKAADESVEAAREDYRKRIEFRSWLVFGAIILLICVFLVVSFFSK